MSQVQKIVSENNNILGIRHLEHGEFQQAIACLELAVEELGAEAYLELPIVLFNLGNAYAAAGQFAQAIERYLQSLIYAPQYELTRKHLVACIDPCISSANAEAPNIAELLMKFKDHMGWSDVLENASSTKEFLHLFNAARLCGADSILLDISAGFGRNKDFFAHAQYVAIDLEVAADWDFSNLDLVGNSLNLPIKDNSVDVIINSSSLEHYDNPFAAFHQFARILKPGGSLYLDVPFSYLEHQIPHDYFRYSRYGLASLCKKNGLDVINIQPDCGAALNAVRMLTETLTSMAAVMDENLEQYKIYTEAIDFLGNKLKPVLQSIDIQQCKNGVGDDIRNCSQYPVRYNLVARKPGTLALAKHYAHRAELLMDIAECPNCHRSGLDWQADHCSCPACSKRYSRNKNGIPNLIIE